MGEQSGPIIRWFRRWQDADDAGPDWWVDLATGQVEKGRQSPAAQRMGPYATREAAEHAFERARERNEAWEAEDRRRRAEDRGEDPDEP